MATTSGLDDFGRLRVVVRASVGELSSHRLVVQSYAPDAIVGGLPGRYERPLAAAQRAVSDEDLARGVDVTLVHSGAAGSEAGCVVVAWIEEGAPDLDFDGLCARPVGAVFFGTCHASSERAQVVLARSAA
ncbi:MAG: hypothetical protein RJA70_616 [Pseudomonadota bacterium]